MSWRTRAVIGLAKFIGLDSQAFFQSVFGSTPNMPRRGSKELLDAYDQLPWFRAVMSKIAYTVASNPWQLFVATRTPTKGSSSRTAEAIRRRDVQRCTSPTQRRKMMKLLAEEDSLREVVTHPLLDLLDHGNSEFSGQTCFELSQIHLDIIGEALWVFDRNGMQLPTDIWPQVPTWVSRWPDKAQPTFLIANPRGVMTVPKEDVLYLRHPAPNDPYNRGSGLGHAMADELETDEYASKMVKAKFRNFARPDLLVTGEGISRSEADRIQEDWMGKLAGKPGVPHFLNKKVDVKELSQSFVDLQLSQLRKDERDILIHVIGMPPEILGIIENSNRSTIDAADYLLNKYVVIPRLEFWRTYLQMRVAEVYDPRLILDYVNPIGDDDEFDLKVMQASPWAFEVDEHREMAGKRPLNNDAGKIFVVPFNMTAVKAHEDLAAPEPETEPDDEETPVDAV